MKIKVSLNGVTKNCEVLEFPLGFMVLDHDVKLVTMNGNKEHIGTLFVDKDGNVTNALYTGMRGNGNANRSKFKHISWAD